MKIAIIGAGIAGNTIAWHLYKKHEITVFEAESHIGGHTHTHPVHAFGREYHIDTGFIVYNNKTYPQFIKMLDALEVETQASSMSFSVRDETSGLEYNGTTLNSMFAQRTNLLNPKFLWMIKEILRFNKEAPKLLDSPNDILFGEYLDLHGYSKTFIKNYIIPMGSAIWSADPQKMFAFPASFFIRFFHNHGMLNVSDRPQWRVIKGGSQAYVNKLVAGFKDCIYVNTRIEQVTRTEQAVVIKPQHGEQQKFDWVFFACHSDQALNMLTDASHDEKTILGALPYQKNNIVLHTDATLMPKRRLAWAAWNYHLTATSMGRATVTYNMSILQSLSTPQPFLVTLNHTEHINHEKIIKTLNYSHPVFTIESIRAQSRHDTISGVNRTAYAGAYWRNGFHEDGVVSALASLKHFEEAQKSG